MASAGAAALTGATRAVAAPEGGPPPTPLKPVTDTYFGETVVDPYRWMETADDPQWKAWLKAQADYAEAALAASPRRAALKARLDAVSSANGSAGTPYAAGPWLFIRRRQPGASTPQMFVRARTGGPERLVFDPAALRTPGGPPIGVSEALPSPDGRWLLVGVFPGGSEEATLRLIEVESGRYTPLSIDRCHFARPSWLPDSTGFFYNRLPADAPATGEHKYDGSAAWLHILGSTAPDLMVLEPAGRPGEPPRVNDLPEIVAFPDSDWALGTYVTNNEFDGPFYVARLDDLKAGRRAWRKIATTEQHVESVALRGDRIYMRSRAGAPRFEVRMATAQAGTFANARVVVPESALVIQAIAAASDGLYVRSLDAGRGHLRRLHDDGRLEVVTLPARGSLFDAQARPDEPDLWFGLDDQVTPTSYFHRASATGVARPLNLTPDPPFDVTAYETTRVMVTARDGAKVPLDLTYRKGLKRDGSAPVLIEAYGAYGVNMEPYFDPGRTPFLDAGAVFAEAHVRGGGEFGEDWHTAGMMATKANTWRDAIDCAEWLVKAGGPSPPTSPSGAPRQAGSWWGGPSPNGLTCSPSPSTTWECPTPCARSSRPTACRTLSSSAR